MAMKKNRFNSVCLAVVALILVSPACSTFRTPPVSTPTAVSTSTSTSLPTATARPTNTLWLTQTPDIAATKAIEETNARTKDYLSKGYISTTNGQLYKLDDYSKEYAEINYLSGMTSTGYDNPVADFIFRADFHWENAIKNPETSGCGLYYRIQSNGDFYSVYLDTDRIVMGGYTAALSRYVQRFGVTSGSGRVGFGNPADANFTLILNGYMAYVLVNDEFIGSYTLHTDKMLDPGIMGYFIKSGTNKDFGTRCKITNATLWVPNK
jgi:hypothetical protein